MRTKEAKERWDRIIVLLDENDELNQDKETLKALVKLVNKPR